MVLVLTMNDLEPMKEALMERELGTDRRDVPHAFAGEEQSCEVCDKSPRDARHEEWEKVETASRQSAFAAGLPRVQG
jgi:hypothetical protein